ncbi:hypothetical protein SBRCBS47491_006583 [Sporothrix bragantina]|uniref:Xylanolytic transcriptional activator regulatory domain-containing protein n=1 Tax=Sporothrix bragantina TaxID=671064 RepID=A0ABP0C647_9PEZI
MPLNKVPPRDTIRRSVKTYTQYIYPLPRFSFIHAPAFNASVSSGDVDPALVFAVCGTSALYAPTSDITADVGLAWMETSEDLLMKTLDRPSLQRLQALLLVILHRLESRGFSKAFMLVAFAARAAFALRLNYEQSQITIEEQEIRRRVMWSTWATEKFWAGGLREFSLCPDNVINIRLPCPEELLETGESVEMDYLQMPLPVSLDVTVDADDAGDASGNGGSGSARDPGLLALCCRLFAMRGLIIRKTKKLLSRPCQPEEVVAAIRDIEHQLRSLRKTFGPHTTLSRENIVFHAKGRWLSRYIMVYTSWHQCHCDAYRVLLSGYYWAVPDDVIQRADHAFVAHCQQQCREHAQSIIDALCAVLDLPMELPLMDPDLATCAFQSARILHYVHSKTPDTSQQNSWKVYNMLQSCVEVVKKIFGNKPVTAPVISDLQVLAQSEFGGARQVVGNMAEMPLSDPMWSAKSQQLLERHSLIRRANFINDSPDADTATMVNPETTNISMLTPSSTTAPYYGAADPLGRFGGPVETTQSTAAVAAAAAADLPQQSSDYARQDAAATLAMGPQMQQYQWGSVCPTSFQDLELLLSSEMHVGGWWANQDQ